MGGIASAIIIPPSGSGFERVVPGTQGEESFHRISVVQRIAPAREDGRNPGARPRADDGAPGRKRDHRQVRQLVVRSGPRGGPQDGPYRLSGRTGLAVREADAAALQNFGAAAFASALFLAQMIGQTEEPIGGPLASHRDGAEIGSDAYRRAGAAPPHYSEQPALFRVAI